jgi:DNA-binding MarR family transcriptional regulator
MAKSSQRNNDLLFRIVTWIGIINQLTGTKGNQLLRQIELPMPQFIMLNHFSHRPDERKTIGDVANAMQQPQPGVTKTIQKLEAKGYLKADAEPSDARVRAMMLTAAGKKIHKQAVSIMTHHLRTTFADWPEQELGSLFAMLDKLKTHLDDHR